MARDYWLLLDRSNRQRYRGRKAECAERKVQKETLGGNDVQKELYKALATYILKVLSDKNSRPAPEEVNQLFQELRLLRRNR